MQCTGTVAHLVQGFGQNVGALLLVDENDDGWVVASLQDFHELVALLVLGAHENDLFDALGGFANCANVDGGWTTQIIAGDSLQWRRHCSCEHHRLRIKNGLKERTIGIFYYYSGILKTFQIMFWSIG